MGTLEDFVRESNRIEGIGRDPTDEEIQAHEGFLARPVVEIRHLIDFVAVLQPDAQFRDSKNVPGVRVGQHIAPPSGPPIHLALGELLVSVEGEDRSPWENHVVYETLHPFTDGNGRSGRALWAWQRQMQGRSPFKLGFLWSAYYEALEAPR